MTNLKKFIFDLTCYLLSVWFLYKVKVNLCFTLWYSDFGGLISEVLNMPQIVFWVFSQVRKKKGRGYKIVQ